MIRRIRKILLILIFIVAVAVIFELTRPYRPDNPVDGFVDGMIGRSPLEDEIADESPIYIQLPADADLDGLIPVSEERLWYDSGVMTLIIPSLDFDGPVQAGTSRAALKRGPGLFESSGMPGQPGANVSIAGHRTRSAFYYLNRLRKEDRIYLIYNSFIYTYVFYDRSVVHPTQWDVISEQGFDACTLITCTPIGVADKRMVVRFILESVDENEISDIEDQTNSEASDMRNIGYE